MILVILGGVFGAASQGILKIEGITPKKLMKGKPKGEDAKKDEAKKEDKPAPKVTAREAPELAPKPKAPEPPKTDPQKGAERLAELWNEFDTDTLLKVSADWKEPDLVRVLAKMDNAKVVAYLAAVAKEKPEKASKLSKMLQDDASLLEAKAS